MGGILFQDSCGGCGSLGPFDRRKAGQRYLPQLRRGIVSDVRPGLVHAVSCAQETPQVDIAGTKVASQESAAAKLDLYWIRDSAVCALLGNTGGNFSEAVPDAAPNAWSVFGNAEQLPLSECRRPHEFVVVHKGHYAFLSNVIASLPALPGRNFSLTFCVNSNNTIRFSCYRARHKNGETHFVAPTDYERVFFRGPVGLHESPRTFETLDYAYLPLIQNETECATFLTVSSYGVRTDSGDCVHLYRYALFKEYPEMWNWYEDYRDGVTDNAFYDCQFGADPELWNYPTREEVSRCADYAPRVACSTVSVDSEAHAPYFYAGRDIGEMTQNSMDRESCHPHNTDDYGSSDSAGEYHSIYYTRAAKYGGAALLWPWWASSCAYCCVCTFVGIAVPK
ncbi:hypothetical protein V5799_031275 [Amblyomma americanum]|uniref:Uncharacterized protein n=1 Tax=Amblyomma americanum TaxID=6943 RepID=A0AAQ4EL84_AMBAM